MIQVIEQFIVNYLSPRGLCQLRLRSIVVLHLKHFKYFDPCSDL